MNRGIGWGMLLLIATSSMAQEPDRFGKRGRDGDDSHIRLPGGDRGTDWSQRYGERLRNRANQTAEMQRLLRSLADDVARNRSMADILSRLQSDPALQNNPDLLERLARMGTDLSDRSPADRLKQLEELLKQLRIDPASIVPPDVKTPPIAEPPTVREPPVTPRTTPDGPPPPPTIATPPMRPDVPIPQPAFPEPTSQSTPPKIQHLEPTRIPPPSDELELTEERIRELTRQLERLAGPLRDSPTFQKALENLARTRTVDGRSLLDQISQYQSRFRSSSEYLRKHLTLPEGWSPPDLRFSPPDLKLPRSTPAMPHVPTAPSMPDLPTTPSRASVVTVGGILAVFAALVFGWMLFQRDPRHAVAARFRRNLDPDAVQTPTDLIAAFEGLALGRFGEPARVWHHRAAADKLADPAEVRPAVDRLAELYARARYSPSPIPPGDLADARRCLALLVGKTAV